ncbi:MAG: hypothetical protein GWP70_04190 [Proteobacteria bacterium]|nr:hypothetical protein [Pseudomonadota bacterium]
MTSCTAYVINLSSHDDRRVQIQQQLLSLPHCHHHFIEGINGEQLTARALHTLYQSQPAARRTGRLFTFGETGCALSYQKAYLELLASPNLWGLIFEDDVEIPTQLSDLLSDRLEGKDLTLIALFTNGSRKFSTLRTDIKHDVDTVVCDKVNQVRSRCWVPASTNNVIPKWRRNFSIPLHRVKPTYNSNVAIRPVRSSSKAARALTAYPMRNKQTFFICFIELSPKRM